MAGIVVCGAGVVGLATAVMLARDGHQVTVLDADAEHAPENPRQAWSDWSRRGVAQFRQPHQLMRRFQAVCDEELPDVTQRLLAAGCVWVNYLESLPRSVTDRSPRPGDEHFPFVTGRRPVVEAVFAELAAEQPGVTVRRGVQVSGVLTGASALPGVPHVTGVVTAEGEQLPADLVIDATGRRTRTTQWLLDAGAAPPLTEATDLGYVYYTRYYTGPERPRLMGRALAPIGSFSLLTLYGDNDTWSVTIYGSSGDGPLKAVREPRTFDRVLAACPLQAHWTDGCPVGGVYAMAGVLDRYRRLVVDGRPVVTGFTAVGDAWASTNPSAGRGLAIGVLQAQQLRHALRAHRDGPADLAFDLDERTEREVTPFYRYQVGVDRARIAEMTALRDGAPPPPPAPGSTALVAAAAFDGDAYRGLLDIVFCMAQPHEVAARPAVRAAIERHGDAPVPSTPGPDRAQLERLLAE